MSALEPPLPTFLIIGAQKSATRWLRYNLGLHPQVFTPRRELSFFNSTAFKKYGVDWYRAQFQRWGWAGEPIVGEATPGYMIWRHRPYRVARRIKETIPDVRLIAILRDPVDRANSAMVHHIRRRRLRSRSKLVDVVRKKRPEEDRMSLVAGGWYAASLKPFVQLFGDQVLVLLHDEVRDDPLRVYERALQHIGATTDFVPEQLHEVVFTNQQSDSPTSKREISPEDRARLYEYFRQDIRQLERMLGRDLSSWKPSQDTDQGSGKGGPSFDEPAEHFRTVVAWIETIIQPAAPSDVETWEGSANQAARVVLDRMIADAYFSAEALERHALPNGNSRFGSDRPMPPVSDPVDAYRQAADRLHAALADPNNLEGQVFAPLRNTPAAVYAAKALTKQLVGGWELACLLGRDSSPPSELLDLVRPVAQGLAYQEYLVAARADRRGTPGETTDSIQRFVEFFDQTSV